MPVNLPILPEPLRPPPLRFTADDIERAHFEWGCNCGPAALAAVTGRTLAEVRAAMPDFPDKRFTSPSMMWRALDALRVRYTKTGSGAAGPERGIGWPRLGLARIQFGGPWCKAGVPLPARYTETHWVGAYFDRPASEVYVYDVNAAEWRTRHTWRREVLSALLADRKRGDGTWWITHSVEVRV